LDIQHSHIHNLGIESLHATMPVDLKVIEPNALASLQSVLSGKHITYKIPSAKENRLGRCKGALIGGNLSVLYSMLGSKGTINTDGKILFLEDLDEYLYHIDRILMNLKRNGYFEKLNGLIIGGMVKMHDNKIPFGKSVKEIILDITSEYTFPVLFDFPAGHIKDNRSLIFGREVVLEINNDTALLTI